jgi:hypothetical protein
MDGFKNSTKTRYDTMSGKTFANGGMVVSRNDMPDGQGPMSKPAMVAKYAKGGAVKKIAKVMGEFKRGELHSGSKKGPEVTSKKQATAIALSEARKAGAKIPVKRREGTPMGEGPEGDDALMARMTPRELAMGRAGIAAARARLAGRRADPMGSVRESERANARDADPSGSVRSSDAERYKKMPPKKAVPVAPKRPLIEAPSAYGPAKRLSIPLRNGGLAVMPKKGC